MWFLHIQSFAELLIGLAVRVFIILCILPVHEYAHGWMANKLGDDTAERAGRLTLNPLAHIDWLGAAGIILLGFGWAKPVPINPYRFNNQKNRKLGVALTALAGPVSNLLFAFIGCILLRAIGIFADGEPMWWVTYGFYFLIYINVTLAVFNLIPIYPLDGSRILSFFMPDSWDNFVRKYGNIIMIAFVVIIFTGLLSSVLSFLVGGVSRGLFSAVDRFFDFIGLDETLYGNASFSYFGLTR